MGVGKSARNRGDQLRAVAFVRDLLDRSKQRSVRATRSWRETDKLFNGDVLVIDDMAQLF